MDKDAVRQLLLRQLLHSKQCRIEGYFFEWFQAEILTREAWATVLGISRKTLRRWEEEIIKQRAPVKVYFYQGRGSSKGYDAYQRFLTLVIYQVKQTRPDGVRKATNKDVIDFFNQSYNGASVWRILGRDNFNRYLEVNDVYKERGL